MRTHVKLTSLTIAVLFVMVSGFAMVEEVEVGKSVPDFSLTDLDGKSVKLSDYAGKVVVLEWTNPNCPFVVRVYREGIMTGVQKKYGDKVVWLTVNSTNPNHKDFETAEALKKKYAEWKASFASMLLDPEGKVGKLFDAKTTPHMYIIDKNGKLVYAGAIDDDPRGSKSEKVNYVDGALESLFGGKAIAPATTKSYGCTVKY
jgi:peroxiredoxin